MMWPLLITVVVLFFLGLVVEDSLHQPVSHTSHYESEPDDAHYTIYGELV